jgi:hypothetical protein
MSSERVYCIDCETACGCGDQPDAENEQLENARPALETYLCVNSVEIPARITSGDVVQAIRLPSGTVLLKLGDVLLTTDEAVLIASFVNV